jgi:HTH-like domain
MASQLPVAVVCRVLGAPRSSVYARRASAGVRGRPGPATSIRDCDLVELIRQVLDASPFAGEGYRKVRARLRREHGVQVSGKRVLRLLRREGLLAPQRIRGRRPHLHDGTIIPDRPNVRWGTDATMAWTRVDGWVWVLPAWITTPPRPGRMWPRSATASPPSSRSTTPSSTAGAAWTQTSPAAWRCATTGAAIPFGALHWIPGLAGDQR